MKTPLLYGLLACVFLLVSGGFSYVFAADDSTSQMCNWGANIGNLSSVKPISPIKGVSSSNVLGASVSGICGSGVELPNKSGGVCTIGEAKVGVSGTDNGDTVTFRASCDNWQIVKVEAPTFLRGRDVDDSKVIDVTNPNCEFPSGSALLSWPSSDAKYDDSGESTWDTASNCGACSVLAPGQKCNCATDENMGKSATRMKYSAVMEASTNKSTTTGYIEIPGSSISPTNSTKFSGNSSYTLAGNMASGKGTDGQTPIASFLRSPNADTYRPEKMQTYEGKKDEKFGSYWSCGSPDVFRTKTETICNKPVSVGRAIFEGIWNKVYCTLHPSGCTSVTSRIHLNLESHLGRVEDTRNEEGVKNASKTLNFNMAYLELVTQAPDPERVQETLKWARGDLMVTGDMAPVQDRYVAFPAEIYVCGAKVEADFMVTDLLEKYYYRNRAFTPTCDPATGQYCDYKTWMKECVTSPTHGQKPKNTAAQAQ